MGQSISRKRPWLAALLAALVTGLGHLYLRRWRRAVGWLAVSFGVTVLFTEPAAVDAFVSGTWGLGTLLAVAPMFLVVGLSIVDAYLLAWAQNADARPSNTAGEDSIPCPHCGNDLDSELEFCHWCTKPVGELDQD
ncbi:DUF7575 domain-containing protein [Natrinema salifodinae]|uniref:DUF7575 domain-containing protein n=1 Tax=Natrinema salifodinae TaxID=1202768 RepID=A0A1I0QW99_9EURY|nr:hypothetical protein [Natrinema salifodinae]SEW31730.1 hypothetical protein SAMN05216285_4042 [Natrinema salifodinae]